MMTYVATQVMTKVNAPYGTGLSAHQLASMIGDPNSVIEVNGPVFSFFSEVPAEVQKQFIAGMGVDQEQVSKVADEMSKATGYPLPLAA
jgi:hypothetical protein